MSDCPNCGTEVGADASLCGSCGFDVHTAVASEVRRLREEGRIEPGRLQPRERSVAPVDARGERETDGGRAEHLDAGL